MCTPIERKGIALVENKITLQNLLKAKYLHSSTKLGNIRCYCQIAVYPKIWGIPKVLEVFSCMMQSQLLGDEYTN